MAEAYASAVIDAPVEAVWDLVRDFNGLPGWHPAIADSTIEDGRDADTVGCIRSFHLKSGEHVRERLLMLDDSRYAFTYDFQTPAFPVTNYLANFELIPVTDGDRTFAQWRATFDEEPEDAGKYTHVISRNVFHAGLQALSEKVSGRPAPEGAVRWQGMRPAKVFCSAVLHAAIDTAWGRMRDFARMDEWHPDLSDMKMLDGARPDRISGVRHFRLGSGELDEQLTLLCDRTHAFRYKINRSPMPWLNYHAGARLWPVTATGETFAVWTADWSAAPNDDVSLIPTVHNEVFRRAFDTLNERYFNVGA